MTHEARFSVEHISGEEYTHAMLTVLVATIGGSAIFVVTVARATIDHRRMLLELRETSTGTIASAESLNEALRELNKVLADANQRSGGVGTPSGGRPTNASTRNWATSAGIESKRRLSSTSSARSWDRECYSRPLSSLTSALLKARPANIDITLPLSEKYLIEYARSVTEMTTTALSTEELQALVEVLSGPSQEYQAEIIDAVWRASAEATSSGSRQRLVRRGDTC